MNAVKLLKEFNAPIGLQGIFEKAGSLVSRYETIDKTDGKSFGIYLYKDNVEVETTLVNDILDYLKVSDGVRQFVLKNYRLTPGKEEFCLHFPLGSDALIRTHTKPTKDEHIQHKRVDLGSLGIKGFTLDRSGQIKDIKYYYLINGDTITTLKYSTSGDLIDTITTKIKFGTTENAHRLLMTRDDGQIYNMYSHHMYCSFI